jgi:hypothetical protein
MRGGVSEPVFQSTCDQPKACRSQGAEDLAKALVEQRPEKIDLGPVYTVNPRDRKKFEGATAGPAPGHRTGL